MKNTPHQSKSHAAAEPSGTEGERPTPAPPLVTRGAKLQAAVGIDWCRFTIPRPLLEEARSRMAKCLGPGIEAKGIYSYQERLKFTAGAFLAFSDESRPECCIELPGEACRAFGHAGVLKWFAWITEIGGRCTRVDIRLDFKGNRVGLIDAVRQSCERRELCRCRTWEPREPRTNEGERQGYSVNLGKRSKNGSGRYVRVYDKGLESEKAAEGEWERWEVEFTGDVAIQVMHRLAESPAWEEDALSLALGAVEFREHTGSRSLKRRPLASWWELLLGRIKAVTVREKRERSTLVKWGSWYRRCVMPTIDTMAEHAGMVREAVVEYFTGHERFAKRLEHAPPVVFELLDELMAVSQPTHP
ncbi:MAG: replication initiation factor domain-containing protein [Planctomycetota bacterium]